MRRLHRIKGQLRQWHSHGAGPERELLEQKINEGLKWAQDELGMEKSQPSQFRIIAYINDMIAGQGVGLKSFAGMRKR